MTLKINIIGLKRSYYDKIYNFNSINFGLSLYTLQQEQFDFWLN